MDSVQLKAEIAAQNVVAQQTCGTRFFQRFFKPVIGLENFAVNVVVAHRDAHGIGGNGHAFNHDVRVELQDVAVFAGTWLAFIRIAHQVFLTWKLARHEAPLQAGRKARTATPAQCRFFDRCNHLVLRHASHCAFSYRAPSLPRILRSAW